MLKEIQKNLNKLLNTAPATTQMEDTKMEQDVLLQEQLDAALETNTTLEASLADANSKLAELTGKLASLEATFAASEELKAKAEQEALEAKMKSRKEQIVAAVGSTKADALFAATENLDDTQFAAVIGAMDMKLDTESESSLFVEQGASGDVDLSKVVDPADALLKQLQEKYSAKA